jgi:hypothetical protein
MNKDTWQRSGGAAGVLAVLFFVAAAFCSGAYGQIPQAAVRNTGAGGYDVARESVISGKVLEYSAAGKSVPRDAHVTVQTGSGTVDAHLGNAKMLTANHLTLEAGDSVSITGETVAYGNGTVFLARVIQKGAQSVAVRSRAGMPLLPTARAANGQIVVPEGVR